MSLLRYGGVVCFGVPGVSVYCSLDSLSGPERVVINFEGSSSMKPIIEALLEDYLKDNSQNISINIATIGSRTGLQRIIDGTGDFALVSHDINNFLNEDEGKDFKQKWAERKLKTITLAKDAMFLVYKPPKDCNKELIISDKNVKDVYSLFSAHKTSDVKTNLKELIDNIDNSEKCDVNLVPWAKGAGPIKSGTAKSFVDNPLLKDLCCEGKRRRRSVSSGCDGSFIEKVKKGEYGDENKIYYVHEYTPMHWDSFMESPEGSITYLPSHFVFLNKAGIDNSGAKVSGATFSGESRDGSQNNVNINDFEQFSKDISKYQWGRTFNLVYSVDGLSEKKKNVIEGIVNSLAEKMKKLKLVDVKYKIKRSEVTETETEIEIEKEDKSGQYGIPFFKEEKK